MTAAEYLASEPVGNADLLEMLRRGTADVLYCTQHALAMHERVSGAAVLCAETEREARAALEHLPHTGLYVAHGALCARLLREETGCTGGQKCRQARYLRPVPPAPVPGVELRILDESHTDLVFEHYHMAPGRDYVAERLAAGAMTGAFWMACWRASLASTRKAASVCWRSCRLIGGAALATPWRREPSAAH